MTKKLLLLCMALLCPVLMVVAQEKYTISGTIREAKSNETLIGVTIAIQDLRTGTTTNEYGFYSITLPRGEYNLIVSYLGFQDISRTVSLTGDVKIDFNLNEAAEQLEEVVVTARKREESLQDIPLAVTAFSAEQLRKALYRRSQLRLHRCLLAVQPAGWRGV